jgi:hypothetical protein
MPQPVMADAARHQSSKFAVFRIARQVPEAVEDVVHPHQRGRGLGAQQGFFVQAPCGLRRHGFYNGRLARRPRAAHRRAPGLLFRQFGLPEYVSQVDAQVLGVLRDGFQ